MRARPTESGSNMTLHHGLTEDVVTFRFGAVLDRIQCRHVLTIVRQLLIKCSTLLQAALRLCALLQQLFKQPPPYL